MNNEQTGYLNKTRLFPQIKKNLTAWIVSILTLVTVAILGVKAGPTQLANTIVLGGMWALMGVGLALMFGVMNASNFAHGEAFMLGSYTAYFVYNPVKQAISGTVLEPLAPIPGLLVAVVCGALLGFFIENALLSPLRKRTKKGWIMNVFLLTAGVSFVMSNGVRLLLGTRFRGVTEYWNLPPFHFLGIILPADRAAAFIVAVISIAGLWYFLQRTDTGRAIRAVSQDEEGARMVGIKVKRIYSLTFSLATALATLAGACLLFMFPAFPTVGIKPLYVSWYILMLVGMGNVGGSIAGGFIVAVLQTATQYFLGTMWEDVVPLLGMILVLLVAPSGIFGSEVKGINEQ
ncbi:MAG: branched-chain amino acid ABC transporter permease [Anaerolineales bacterium]|nr:branched-chain amino acid ABC transporter permease [Anaerolineales bacterium]